MDIKEVERKINKICSESSREIMEVKGKINSILINFAKEYNEIWREYEHRN